MTLADRILEFRKIKGISQEELADKIGVSRQAVSKWESGQSIPDIDKIILLSDFFDVTTDLLLRGIENNKRDNSTENTYIFNSVATSLNFLGLLISIFIWNNTRADDAILAGFIFMIIGTMIFTIGKYQASNKDKLLFQNKFWKINIWIIVFIPLSIIYNLLFSHFMAPYPILSSNTYMQFILFFIIYIFICSLVTYIQSRKEKQNSK